jgi:hypothetical protein
VILCFKGALKRGDVGPREEANAIAGPNGAQYPGLVVPANGVLRTV